MYMTDFSSEAPSADSRPSRRSFLRTGVAASGGLLIMINAPMFRAGRAAAADTLATNFAPSAFIRIDQTGQVSAIIPQVEIGPGCLYVDADAHRRRAGAGPQPHPS